ncbi:N-formylglutamate amidohydrolase [Ramlibacter sp. WS9]|uniref:N-formylglutamate amidohydrolase n=1 Tax=Ramlibacter sp. WS9 TaxID=1882741 RepID=UPI001141B086|nr:N-formylglutamate amidohydrolase [Ramlibacter sp. WS9]ROZ79468.1 N-formylglutamate amidohydrolase [Ramlibacter sp. WS9]
MHIEPEVFYRFDPAASPAPVVVDVSRSGRFYPIDFRSPIPFTALHDNVSMYVDEIWKDAPAHGATMLQALFPNTYIDANRHELDIDPSLIEGEWPVPVQFVSKSGLGLLKTVSRYGEPLQERKLTVAEVQHRLDRYFHPYHRALASAMDRMLTAHGFYYNFSCHCMSAVGAPTHADAGKERMDFCLGNLRGTSSTADFIEFVAEVIRGQGFTCSVNTPYTGGELNRRYGNADGTRESIMVEINKRTFMDVKTFKKNDGFDAVQNVARAVLQAVAQRARERIGRSA